MNFEKSLNLKKKKIESFLAGKYNFLNFSAHLAAVHGPSMFAGTDINTFRENILSLGTHLWDAK